MYFHFILIMSQKKNVKINARESARLLFSARVLKREKNFYTRENFSSSGETSFSRDFELRGKRYRIRVARIIVKLFRIAFILNSRKVVRHRSAPRHLISRNFVD